MEVANTQVIYDTASITSVKSFKAQARGTDLTKNILSKNLLFIITIL
jgi:hypothetical protein